MSQSPNRILFVLTSASKDFTGNNTGWYLPEVAHPYYVLKDHFAIDFASPAGPNPPLDPSSKESYKDDEESQEFWNSPDTRALVENAKPLHTVRADDYAAIFYVGGRGPVMDLPIDVTNIKLASNFYRSGKIIAAVCHGPAALVNVMEQDDKTSIFKGKTVTGFSNAEEKEVGMTKGLPFLLEDRLRDLGATYVKADKPWAPKVVHSGKIMTGQNPESARPLAEALLRELQNQNRA